VLTLKSSVGAPMSRNSNPGRGPIRAAARRRGLTTAEYVRKLEEGWCWCYGCKAWLTETKFSRDRSRKDGIGKYCRNCKSDLSHDQYCRRVERQGRKVRIWTIWGVVEAS
jgi:predicted amidophosphoribosyltransferase